MKICWFNFFVSFIWKDGESIIKYQYQYHNFINYWWLELFSQLLTTSPSQIYSIQTNQIFSHLHYRGKITETSRNFGSSPIVAWNWRGGTSWGLQSPAGKHHLSIRTWTTTNCAWIWRFQELLGIRWSF